MSSRKLIAYTLIALMLGGLAAWAWLSARRKRLELERNHGPRQD
ncbi:MYXO-CTERM sorting domain-containing protein [Novosphingobium flavum]|nr:MYXO-CTERM sorting domain-containing protein [Novosphingobium flavum]